MHIIIVVLVLAISSFIYLKIADKYNIIDKPNHRSSHTIPTIRGGGILFSLAYFLYELFHDFPHTYLTIGVLIVSLVSFIDDIKTLGAKLRFIFHVLAVFLAIIEIGLFKLNFLSVVALIVVGTGMLNFFNFMDGINGITGMYSISVIIGVYLLDYKNIIPNDLFYYQIIALLIFGFYNFRKKARFFAGDIGSISIAIIVFYIVIHIIIVYQSPIFILSLVVYGADAILTLIYRVYLREKLSDAHRHHLYQKLVDRTSLTHLQTSAIYASLQLIICLAVFFVLNYTFIIQIYITILVIAIFVLLYVCVFKVLEISKLGC